MEVRIEFYRTRAQDDAHAVVARVVREATDLDDAIAIARALRADLDMPQRPDAVMISDDGGKELYSGAFDYGSKE